MKIFIQQPVIPEYRVPLFNEVSKSFEIEVHASSEVQGMPRSTCEKTYNFRYVDHESFTKFGGRAYFQKEMEIGESFEKGDILVYNSNPRFISNRKLLCQAKKRGMRIIAWNHANSSSSAGIKSWLRKKMTASKADDLLLYTENEVDIMLNVGWQRKNLYFLNNTIDESKPLLGLKNFSGLEKVLDARNSEAVKRFKDKHNLDNTFNLLYCGRITEKPNLDILIKALSSTNGKYQLLVIGDGDQRSELESLASSLKVSVRWLGAIYEENELVPWFLSSDIFIYPGAIGLSLNHAMAYGLPVITHNLKSKQMPEFSYLEENVNGWKFEYQNESSLTSLIDTTSNLNLERFHRNAFSTIHEKYTFKKMVDNFSACLNNKGTKK